MSIKWTWQRLPVDENGKAYGSLDEFKLALIEKLFEGEGIGTLTPHGMAQIVLDQADYIGEILDITMDARPRARGVKKPRKQDPAKVAA